MATTITLHFEDSAIPLVARKVTGAEQLGKPSRHELELFSPEPVEVSAVLGKSCGLRLANEQGERWIAGIVTKFVRIATAQQADGRRYRAVVEPAWSLLRLRHQSRVFQHISAPDLIQKVLVDAGFAADRIMMQLVDTHPRRDYVVQWQEDDLTFIRRLCEEEGLYFRSVVDGDGVWFVLEDTSSMAATFDEPIVMTGGSGLKQQAFVAWGPRLRTERRAGKVTLVDHDPAHPAAKLEGTASAGSFVEQATEVYVAPGRFRTNNEGLARAQKMLEGLRSNAKILTFETNTLGLAPGQVFTVEHGDDYSGLPMVEGQYLATSIEIRCEAGDETDRIFVEAIPKDVPFRLPRRTPRPRIDGVQTAVVTGAPGTEVHPDDAGRIFVRFYWDREGPTDDKSSLPVRVVQPNMPGSMVIPRVGWEVAVAFEDGDPDRPYVLGRVYNTKTPPPVALPANKTMTVLRSFSSPGGKTHNTISFDDAAGRQHLSIHAGFGKSTSVGNNMMMQTAKVEQQVVSGSQTVSVGANDALTVKEALISEVGSQTATVGGTQNIYVKGTLSHNVGSESVMVGGALLEKVGDPVKGALNLGVNAALCGAGALGQRLGPVGQVATTMAVTAAGVGWGMAQAASAPGAGPNAARDAGVMGLLGAAAGHVPGGSAVFSSLVGGGRALPWQPPAQSSATAEKGGGAGAAEGDAAGAQGPGPGHRSENIKGPYTEMIGGAYVVTTPGNIAWQTSGACAITVGGGHSTKAITVGAKVLGASEETLGSLHIKAKTAVGREVRGAVTTNVGGALKVKAGGEYAVKAGSKITVQAGGAMKCEGGVVAFVVGSSVVAASSGGVLVKANTIKINGATKQSGDTTH